MRLIDADALMDDIKRDTKKAIDEGDKAGSFWLGYAAGSVIAQPTIQPEKAQLSQEGTTSDLISRTETVEHLRRVLGATVPISDYDEGFVDGVEFGVSTVSTMPSVRPQSTAGQLNGSAQSTNLIDRQAALEKVRAMQAYKLFEDIILVDKAVVQTELMMLPTIQLEERTEKRTETHACDLISRQAAIDALEKVARFFPYRVPGNRDTYDRYNEAWNDAIGRAEIEIEELPSAQPETAKRIVGKSRDGMTLWYQCDMCNEPVDAQDNYCRGCGRRLIDG